MFFLLVKGLSLLCIFCFGYTHIAENVCVALFSYNYNEVVLVSLHVLPRSLVVSDLRSETKGSRFECYKKKNKKKKKKKKNLYVSIFYKTSVDFPNPFSDYALDLLYFPLIYVKQHMYLYQLVDWLRRCTPKVVK